MSDRSAKENKRGSGPSFELRSVRVVGGDEDLKSETVVVLCGGADAPTARTLFGTASSIRADLISYPENGSKSICTVTHEVFECAARESAVVSM